SRHQTTRPRRPPRWPPPPPTNSARGDDPLRKSTPATPRRRSVLELPGPYLNQTSKREANDRRARDKTYRLNRKPAAIQIVPKSRNQGLPLEHFRGEQRQQMTTSWLLSQAIVGHH